MKRNQTKRTESVAPQNVEHEMELRSPPSPTACSCFPILSLFKKKDRVQERQREEEKQVQIENENRRLEETVRQQEVEIVRFHEREKRLRQKLQNITEKIARKEQKTLKVIQREERLKRELQAMKERLDMKEKREENEVASKGLVDVEVTVNVGEKRKVQTDGATRQTAEDKPERGGRDGGEAVTVDVESQKVQPAAQSSSGRRMLQSVLSKVRSLIERLRLRFSARHVQADVEDEHEDVSPRRLIPLGAPAGVLTVNLKSCRDFSKSAPLKKGTWAAVKTTVGRTVKYTVLQLYDDPMCFDEWKQFSLQIQREDVFGVEPSSLMVVELIMLDSDSTIPILAGRDTIKLKEILKTSSLNHQCNLRLGQKKVCKLDADLAFTYGSLGYGYSHQMKHAGRTMENLVEKSLFPRCPPNEERDPFGNVVTPSARPQLDILPSVMLQDTQTGTECGISAGVMDCIQRRGRLLQLHQGLDECESGEDRVQFLEKLIMKQSFSTIYAC
ncbi:hypothetical protein AOLI_G00321670 [Acnodon oligacanthus]